MNLNKGCIEIIKILFTLPKQIRMNLNKGCIEIIFQNPKPIPLQGWTLTRVVLKFYIASLTISNIFDEP